MNDSYQIKLFLKYARSVCRENNIKLEFKRCRQIETSPGLKCTGYFDETSIVIAKNHTQWLQVLIHEICHAEQMIEKTPKYAADEKFGNQAFEDWLNGKEVRNINKAITNLLALELDCEKRAVKKIAQYDLPINQTTYIQRANECILYYRYVQKTRHWSNKLVTAYNKMPTKFMSDSYYKKLSPKMERIFFDLGV